MHICCFHFAQQRCSDINRTTTAIVAVVIVIIIAVAGVSFYYLSGPSSITSQTTTTSTSQTSTSSTSSTTSISSASSAQPVKIAVLFPTSGAFAAAGEANVIGVQAAVAAINAAGGIPALGGANISATILDSTSTPDGAKAAAESMLSSGSYAAILGAYASALSLQISTVAEQHQIPFMTYSIDVHIFTRGYNWTFGTAANSSAFGIFPVQYVFNLKQQCPSCVDVSRIAFVYGSDNPSQPAAASSAKAYILAHYNSTGAQVVDSIGYNIAGFTDATPIINKLISDNATLVFMGGSENVLAQMLNTAQGLGFKGLFYGFDGSGVANPNVLEQNTQGTNLVGTLGLFYWSDVIHTGAMASFVAMFHKMFPQYKIVPYVSLMAASTVYTLAAALQSSASTTPQALRAALVGMDLTSGPFELVPVKFNQFGDNTLHSGVMVQFQAGGNVTVLQPQQFSTGQPLTLQQMGKD